MSVLGVAALLFLVALLLQQAASAFKQAMKLRWCARTSGFRAGRLNGFDQAIGIARDAGSENVAKRLLQRRDAIAGSEQRDESASA